MSEFLIKILEALLVAIPTAYLTAKFSLRRYYAEKLWDRKFETYTNIFNALYNMKAYCEEFLVSMKVIGEDAFLEEHQNAELNQRYQRAIDEIKRVSDIGALVISKDAINALKELDYFLRENDFVNHIISLDEQLTSVSKCLNYIRNIAESDLKSSKI